MDEANIPSDDKRIFFAQLYGMGDSISFSLAKRGYNIAKYIPFGPMDDVIPYLMRRAIENSSMSKQGNKEHILIQKELKRRQYQVSSNIKNI